MSFKKSFKTFLTKLYCIVINILHHINIQKARKSPHLSRVSSHCIKVSSHLINLSSYCINVSSVLINLRSHCINLRSLFINLRSHLNKLRSDCIKLRSLITIVSSPMIKVNSHSRKVNSPLIIVFFRLINLYFHIKYKEEYLNIIHTLYKDEHKYWSEPNYFS